MKTPVRSGMLLIVSGPSGSGKSTLAKRMFEHFDGIEFSVSCTTRAMRAGEVHGKDYHFISQEQFREHIANGDFVEFATVHGNSYGTLKSEVISRVESGIDVLLDIDVQGAIQIKKLAAADPFFGRCLETVFVTPPSHTVLEQRLRGRGTDSEEQRWADTTALLDWAFAHCEEVELVSSSAAPLGYVANADRFGWSSATEGGGAAVALTAAFASPE